VLLRDVIVKPIPIGQFQTSGITLAHIEWPRDLLGRPVNVNEVLHLSPFVLYSTPSMQLKA
jgi:hypothetical protein